MSLNRCTTGTAAGRKLTGSNAEGSIRNHIIPDPGVIRESFIDLLHGTVNNIRVDILWIVLRKYQDRCQARHVITKYNGLRNQWVRQKPGFNPLRRNIAPVTGNDTIAAPASYIEIALFVQITQIARCQFSVCIPAVAIQIAIKGFSQYDYFTILANPCLVVCQQPAD